MIKINLLPVREERRRMGARQEQLLIALVLILVGLGVFYWHSSTNNKIKDLQKQISQADQEIKRLSKIVKQVEKFKKDKKTLEGKISVIDELKTHRQVQVHYMDEFNKALPEQVWIDFYQQKGDAIVIRGKSLSTEDIASFMRNLEGSDYFRGVELDQTSQKAVPAGDRKLKINSFSLRFKVVPSGGKG